MGFWSTIGESIGLGASGGSNDTKGEFQWYEQNLQPYMQNLRKSGQRTGLEMRTQGDILRGTGKAYEGFQGEVDSLQARTSGIREAYQGLESSLLRQSELSTGAASVGSMQAARFAGGGRGGMGFGGGAGAIAAQNSRSASMSAQQNLLGSLVGARQLRMQGETQISGMETQMDQFKNQMGFNLRQAQNQDQMGRLQSVLNSEQGAITRGQNSEAINTQIMGGMSRDAITTAMAGERGAADRRGGVIGGLSDMMGF